MVRYSSTGRERNEKECKDDVERDKMNQTQFYPLMKKIRRLIKQKKQALHEKELAEHCLRHTVLCFPS